MAFQRYRFFRILPVAAALLWGAVAHGLAATYTNSIVPVEPAAAAAVTPGGRAQAVVPSGVPARRTYGRIVRSSLSAKELDSPMEINLSLPLRNRAELEARLARGEVLSRAALEPYLPSPEDYAQVRAWLTAQGLVVSLDAATRHTVFARGRVSRVSAILNVTMARVATVDGEFTSAITAP
ncbi:MAG: protease pro-enzyme activation domain-containing protein, partial [Opitutales bacterium]